MRTYKAELSELLAQKNPDVFTKDCIGFIENLNSKELAHLFVDVAFLVSAMKFVEEELWVQNKTAQVEISFNRFIKRFFKTELTPVLFLHAFLEKSSREGIVRAGENAALIEQSVVKQIKSKDPAEQKIFASTTMHVMFELFEFEHQMNQKKKDDGQEANLSLYRTFDVLDEIFGLNYLTNEATIISDKERLYEGAGAGVQSSYATTMIALRYLNPSKNARFVDLGSGYGRVGLAIGLMRPDIDFVGYEYVQARVEIATAAAKNLAMDQHVHFRTQDLAALDFKIPEAENYYIFDSFSEETYKHIVPQLELIGQTRKITIVTKGNARMWFKNAKWSAPQEFYDGNICLFRSR